jgi:hypothetical protein
MQQSIQKLDNSITNLIQSSYEVANLSRAIEALVLQALQCLPESIRVSLTKDLDIDILFDGNCLNKTQLQKLMLIDDENSQIKDDRQFGAQNQFPPLSSSPLFSIAQLSK